MGLRNRSPACLNAGTSIRMKAIDYQRIETSPETQKKGSLHIPTQTLEPLVLNQD